MRQLIDNVVIAGVIVSDWVMTKIAQLAVYGGSDEYRKKMKDLGF